MAPNVLTDVARNRQSEPPRLIHALRGDLDWIVMKALEKDRAHRYETANGFALDVQRHLSCEPVVARPPSWMYRFGRLVRRNQLLFAVTGAATATLLIGLSAVAILLIEKRTLEAENSIYDQQIARAAEAERRKALEPAWGPSRLDETLASTARASALNPQDSLLLLQTAVLQLWFEKTGDHLITCQRALILAASTGSAPDADRAVKIYCLRPSSDPQLIETALTLAQRAANVSQESPNLAWYQMTLGMAEYRHENYLAADQALEAAIQASAGSSSPTHVYAMAGLFRAMSLLRLDKADDARRWFSLAAAKMKPMPAAEKVLTASDANHDDLILWLVFKEAKALIEPEK
jgi:tetratricopeptide (TPR) repeat protein